MQDIWADITAWADAQKHFAIATVIETWGSAPRRPGASMAISDTMQVVGSVSGGCIEAAVIETAQEVLADGIAQTLSFGVSNETAWQVGLSCGGQIRVHIAPFFGGVAPDAYAALTAALSQNQPAVLLMPLAGQATGYGYYIEQSNEGVATGLPEGVERETLRQSVRHRASVVLETPGGAYFAQVFPRKPQLFILGATHIAVALVALAHRFHFETVVLDPRRVFTDPERFPVRPDRLLTDWPQEVLPNWPFSPDTYAVLLSHDPKMDDPALQVLLQQEVAYIGALGGRKSQEKRRQRLRAAGFSAEAIARIHGPVGLDLGAQTPDEIALSIMAEVLRVRNAAFVKSPL